MTYFEFAKRFPDENSAIDFIVATKYKDGYVCSKCGSIHKGIYHQKHNHRFMYCNNCKSEFSALKGTIFENTHLDFRMWLYAMNLVLVSRKGISALKLKSELDMGSCQSVWRMLQQIRKAMEKESYNYLLNYIKSLFSHISRIFSEKQNSPLLPPPSRPCDGIPSHLLTRKIPVATATCPHPGLTDTDTRVSDPTTPGCQ